MTTAVCVRTGGSDVELASEGNCVCVWSIPTCGFRASKIRGSETETLIWRQIAH